MDETLVQVLKELGRAACTSSYTGVQRSGCPGQSVILFDYAPSRSGRVPRRLLAGWQGYPVTDRAKPVRSPQRSEDLPISAAGSTPTRLLSKRPKCCRPGYSAG